MATNHYPRTPIEALQCKLAAITSLRAIRRDPQRWSDRPEDLAAYETALRQSAIYQWCDHMAGQVLAMAETFPLDGEAAYLQPEATVVPRLLAFSFNTFDRPVMPRLPGGPGSSPVSALLTIASRSPTTNRIQYRFCGLDWDGGGVCLPAFETGWPLYQVTATDEQRHHADALMRFMLTASQFVEQRIMVEATTALCRAGRKLAARAKVSPLIKTIQLRAREHAATHPSGGGHIDYTCRWIVRGHWRNQFYPKTSDHRPVFIEPHIKGPEDQPLKTPAPDVFVVNR